MLQQESLAFVQHVANSAKTTLKESKGDHPEAAEAIPQFVGMFSTISDEVPRGTGQVHQTSGSYTNLGFALVRNHGSQLLCRG
jgi:hypothetical protein